MKGKDKCKILKELRREIAENNDIEFVVSECKHQGDCKGTCPKCEAEVAYLERELEKRRNLGKKVAVAGLSIGMAASMAGCTNVVQTLVVDPIQSVFNNVGGGGDLAGVAEPDPYLYEGEPTEYIPEDGSEEMLDGDVVYIPEDDSEEDISDPYDDKYMLAGEIEYDPDFYEQDSEEPESEIANSFSGMKENQGSHGNK